MNETVAVVVFLLLCAGGLAWRWSPSHPPPDPPALVVPAPQPVVAPERGRPPMVSGPNVWMILMDADEHDIVASEYIPASRRPFKARYEGVEYLASRGSVDEGYFIYRQVTYGAH